MAATIAFTGTVQKYVAGSALANRLVENLPAGVVGDARVVKIDCHPFDTDRGATTGLVQAKHDIRLVPVDGARGHVDGATELGSAPFRRSTAQPEMVSGNDLTISQDGLVDSPPNGVKPVTSTQRARLGTMASGRQLAAMHRAGASDHGGEVDDGLANAHVYYIAPQWPERSISTCGIPSSM